MASKTLGRVPCPIRCGHDAAQVKIKTDKGEKAAHPYVHCAGCGVQLHTRSAGQAEYLMGITRPEVGVAPQAAQDAPKAAPATPAKAAAQSPALTPPSAPKGMFAGLFGAA